MWAAILFVSNGKISTKPLCAAFQNMLVSFVLIGSLQII